MHFFELTDDEYGKIFRSLGKHVVWITISGGEPYLRVDLPEICAGLQANCGPSAINIATNGLLPEIIQESTARILQSCSDTIVTVNLSLDGMEEEHDLMRGIAGNFVKALETYRRLKELKESFPNLRLGMHSVVSRFNIGQLPKLHNYVTRMVPDSYITEIAENRAELFNMGEAIAPNPQDYVAFVKYLLDKTNEESRHVADGTSKLIQAFRRRYYDTAAKEVTTGREIIPCYAGYASAQITPNGDVWPCCIFGNEKTMGNLRNFNFNFRRLWRSKKAQEVREWIGNQKCHCQLANAHYTNILCNPSSMLKVLFSYLSSSL